MIVNQVVFDLIYGIDSAVALLEERSQNVIYTNKQFEQWFPLGVLDLLGAGGNGTAEPVSLLAERKFETTSRQSTPGVRRVPVEVTVRKIEQDGSCYVVVQVRDVSRIVEKDLMLRSFSAIIDQNNKKLLLQKRAISELLDNMQESVFSVEANLEIMVPVSAYSKILFGADIENKNVFTVVYSSIPSQSELFGSIKTALVAVFGEPELQWEMVADALPRRVERHSSTGESQLLDVSYTPLYDDNGLLERILFVVRDVTEVHRLEQTVALERKASSENIQIIQELADLDRNSVETFFGNSLKLIQQATGMTKQLEQNPKVVHELFRDVHTLKGNARAFKFSLLTGIIHEVEQEIVGVREKHEKNESLAGTGSAIILGLEQVRSQLREYTRLAKRIFGIEDEFETALVADVHRLVADLDKALGPIVARYFMGKRQETIGAEGLGAVHSLKGVTQTAHSLKGVTQTAHSLKGVTQTAHSLKGVTQTAHSLKGVTQTAHSLKGVSQTAHSLKGVTQTAHSLKGVTQTAHSLKGVTQTAHSLKGVTQTAHSLKGVTQTAHSLKGVTQTAHSLKGVAALHGAESIPELVSRVESGIKAMASDSGPGEELFTSLVEPFLALRQQVAKQVFASSWGEIAAIDRAFWIHLFESTFDLLLLTEGLSKLDSVPPLLLEQITELAHHLEAHCYSGRMFYLVELFSIIENNAADVGKIQLVMCELWELFAFQSLIETDIYLTKQVRLKLIQALQEESFPIDGVVDDLNEIPCSLAILLKKCDKKRILRSEFVKKISTVTNIPQPDIVKMFVSSTSQKTDLTSFERLLLECSDDQQRLLEWEGIYGDNHSLVIALGSLLEIKPSREFLESFRYLKICYLVSAIRSQSQGENAEEMRLPRMTHVIENNLLHLKNAVENHRKSLLSSPLNEVLESTESLFELPLGTMAAKFTPMMTDLARTLCKKVDFVCRGLNVALHRDRMTVVQDALLHVLRNAIDHGIEMPSERLSQGKSERASITLAFEDTGGDVVQIEVSDDGKGIDAHKLVQKALHKKIFTPEQAGELSETEKINLIFYPGLSTAEQLTQVSGRGVGMDVVKTSVENLGGTIKIKTEIGKGTTMTMEVPKHASSRKVTK